MSFIEKIDIILKKGIDFLGYDEVSNIIKQIIDNPKLQKDMLNAPDSFWEDAKKGLLVYSDDTKSTLTNNRSSEQIITKYLDFSNGEKHPALVYEKQKKMSIKKIR